MVFPNPIIDGGGTPATPPEVPMFSSDPVVEKQLADYYDFLTKNSSRLNPKQKADLEMIKIRKQFFEASQKTPESLTDKDIKFFDKYGMTPSTSSFTSPNAVDRQRDIINASAANINFVKKVEDIPGYTHIDTYINRKAKFEKAGKESGFKKTDNVYKRTDYVTGEVTYYYVQQGTDSITDLLPKSTGGGTLGGSKTLKPLKEIKLFYSPDYKAVYQKEINEINMMILESAEFALSNYNYETVDSLPSYSPTMVYDENGELLSYNYTEDPASVQPRVTPIAAELAYQIYDNSIVDIRDALDESINTSYANFMSYFGYIKPGTTTVQPRMPGYRKNGTPYYDFEINITDADGVEGYEVYLIEEDDII